MSSPKHRIARARKASKISLSMLAANVPAAIAAFVEGYTTAGWVTGALAVLSLVWNLWAGHQGKKARAQLGEP